MRKKILAFKAVEALVELRPSGLAWTTGTAPFSLGPGLEGSHVAGTVGAASCLLSGCWECWPAPQPPACSPEGFRAHTSPTAQAASGVRGVTQREMRKRLGPYRTAQWEVSQNIRTLSTGLEAPFQLHCCSWSLVSPEALKGGKGRGKSPCLSSVSQAHSSSAPGHPGRAVLERRTPPGLSWSRPGAPCSVAQGGREQEPMPCPRRTRHLGCSGEAEIKLGICSRSWALSCVDYLPTPPPSSSLPPK